MYFAYFTFGLTGVLGTLTPDIIADFHLTRWLWVRLSALGRQSLNPVPQSQTDLAPGTLPWKTGVSGTAALGVEL